MSDEKLIPLPQKDGDGEDEESKAMLRDGVHKRFVCASTNPDDLLSLFKLYVANAKHGNAIFRVNLSLAEGKECFIAETVCLDRVPPESKSHQVRMCEFCRRMSIELSD